MTAGDTDGRLNMLPLLALIMASFLMVPVLALAQSRVGILVQEMGRSQTQAIRGLSEELKRLGSDFPYEDFCSISTAPVDIGCTVR